ncbi:MAG: hypothetical protein ABR541_00615 [Candidatus Dormibacteria bacterium]
MSEISGYGQQPATGGVTGKVQAALPDGASDAVQTVSDKAQQASGQVADQMRKQVDTRSTEAGEQLSTVSQALRSTSEDLRSKGSEAPAKVISPIADRAEQLAQYLKTSDADRILRDVESYGRRQPWTVVAGGVAVGLLASRFLKASSSRRYQGQQSVGAQPFPSAQLSYEPYPTAGTRTQPLGAASYTPASVSEGSVPYDTYVSRQPIAPGAPSSGL